MDAIQAYSSSDEEIDQDAADLILSINPYLQNFSNQKNMGNFFISIPWKPNMATIRHLQRIVNPVLKHIELHHNDFYSRYDWRTVGLSPLDTKLSVLAENLGHHISILMNCQLKSQYSNKFISNFANAIQTLKVPSKLIQSPPELPMSRILPDLAAKSIRLQFEPCIQLLLSSTTPSIFIAAKLLMDQETEAFIESIQDIIRDLGPLVDVPPETIENCFVKTHHISLVKTSDQILFPELDEHEVSQRIELINKELLSYKYPELLQIPITVNSIELKEFTTKTNNHEIAFTI